MIVAVRELSRNFNSRAALSGLSFAVPEGELYAIAGPNGSGKSTLFRILSTMLAPSSGRAEIAGFDVVAEPGKVRHRIGVVFQTNSFDRKLTVDENLSAQGRLYGLSTRTVEKRVGEVLHHLALEDRRDDPLKDLSGGLQRRVEIAKALLHSPTVLLMDEPSTGLDPVARRQLWQYLDGLRRASAITILFTSHILEEVDRADRVLMLHNGMRVAEGTGAELKARVGGDVLVVETADPEALRSEIAARFQVSAQVVDGKVRMEIADGHRFVTTLVEAFPGAINSVTCHKPTLEDVFIDLTGTHL